jgi:hypothetical protein
MNLFLGEINHFSFVFKILFNTVIRWKLNLIIFFLMDKFRCDEM